MKRVKANMVTVIIPFYNTEKYIEKCLETVLNQTYKDLEIICIDDGSTDHSAQIVDRYALNDPRIKVIRRRKENAGAARNVGMEAASGEYVIFLDSDDFFEENLIELAHDKLVAEKSDFCIFGVDVYDEVLEKCVKAYQISLDKFGDERPIALGQNRDWADDLSRGVPWDRLYRTEYIQKNDLRFQSIIRCNDTSFTVCATLLADKVSVIDDVLLHHRKGHGGNLQAGISETPLIYAETALYTLNEMHKHDVNRKAVFSTLDYVVRRISLNGRVFNSKANKDLLHDFLVSRIDSESVLLMYFLAELDKCNSEQDYGDEKTIILSRRAKNVHDYDIFGGCPHSIQSQLVTKIEILRDRLLSLYKSELSKIGLDSPGKTIAIYGTGKHTDGLINIYHCIFGEINANIIFCTTNPKTNEMYLGNNICDVKNLPKALDCIVISSFEYKDEMRRELMNSGIQTKVIDFYENCKQDMFSWCID